MCQVANTGSLVRSAMIARGMGKWDALRGGVEWLVEALYGKRIHRLIESTHHFEAEALANTQPLL